MHLNQLEPSRRAIFGGRPLEGFARWRYLKTQPPLVVLNYEYAAYGFSCLPNRNPPCFPAIGIGDKDTTKTEHFFPSSRKKLKAKGRLPPSDNNLEPEADIYH